ISVPAIAHALRAEGVERIVLLSDAPEKFRRSDFPGGVTIGHRRELDATQRDLRQVRGVSALIYEQTCAAEKRRRRKRGLIEDPKRFAVINELVCEGCGDCSVESNCLSVEPKETPFGRKRKINLSSCNKDFSCLDGFCPSFVTLEGATRRREAAPELDLEARAAALSEPVLPSLEEPYDLLVAGVGGTGVITVGLVIAMAAHLQGLGASALDFTGFSQKFGPVLSYIRLAARPEAIHQARIDEGSADALIGCDLVVSSSPKASSTYRRGARAVVNTGLTPTGDVVRNADADLKAEARLAAIKRALGEANVAAVDANALAEELFGDGVFANMIMLGFAWQSGLAPVSLAALIRAIELNGVATGKNRAAFAAGRLARAAPDFARAPQAGRESLDEAIARRAAFLEAYQDRAWAGRYLSAVGRVRAAERNHGSEVLTDAVARSLFKLMSYKDEYEVARLHLETGFRDELRRHFEGDYEIRYHLAPPFLPLGKDARGRPVKRAFGPWIETPFRLLARMKRLRGTPLDLFGYSSERRRERALIGWYEGLIETMLARLCSEPPEALVKLARAPMAIRGFGPVKESAAKKVQAEVAAMLESAAATVPSPLAGEG
ncbi:MAG: 2-oxoacid:acceptor oxidoreductase family protein, partial [Hyphomicrobiales bacterium]|nr:2-oxoacid:acceptor oxidoreductase family protein [Hyphomicrobiales bacterium]